MKDDIITRAGEDYIEAIYVLGGADKGVKSSDVAAMLCVSRPAVNKAAGELAQRGLIVKPEYGKMMLTPEGKTEAERIYTRHQLLHKFLRSIGVSEDVAKIDCCKIEHFVSEETVTCISRLVEKLDG